MAKQVVADSGSASVTTGASNLDVMRAESALVDAELKLSNTLTDQHKTAGQRAEALQELRLASEGGKISLMLPLAIVQASGEGNV